MLCCVLFSLLSWECMPSFVSEIDSSLAPINLTFRSIKKCLRMKKNLEPMFMHDFIFTMFLNSNIFWIKVKIEDATYEEDLIIKLVRKSSIFMTTIIALSICKSFKWQFVLSIMLLLFTKYVFFYRSLRQQIKNTYTFFSWHKQKNIGFCSNKQKQSVTLVISRSYLFLSAA